MSIKTIEANASTTVAAFLKETKYVALCGMRQTGVTSSALLAGLELQDDGKKVAVICAYVGTAITTNDLVEGKLSVYHDIADIELDGLDVLIVSDYYHNRINDLQHLKEFLPHLQIIAEASVDKESQLEECMGIADGFFFIKLPTTKKAFDELERYLEVDSSNLPSDSDDASIKG